MSGRYPYRRRLAHLFDYVTDGSSRDAILSYNYGSGGGDCGPFIRRAKAEGASGILLVGGVPINSQVDIRDFCLTGEQYLANALPPYGARGSVVELWSRDVQPLAVGRDSGMEKLSFFWPEQVESETAPIEFPPLIKTYDVNTDVAGIRFDSCSVVNSYRFAEIGGIEPFNKGGMNIFSNSRICSVEHTFVISNCHDYLKLSGSQFGWNAYGWPYSHFGPGPYPTGHYLRSFSTENSHAIHVWGDGTQDKSVDGVWLAGAFFFGYESVVFVESSGFLGNVMWEGASIDGCQRLLRCDPGGGVAASTFRLGGGSFTSRPGGPASLKPVFDIEDPSYCSIAVSGRLGIAEGTLMRATGSGIKSISGDIGADAFAHGATTGTHWAVDIDAPNASIDLRTNIDGPPTGGSVIANGVRIQNAAQSRISGSLRSLEVPLQVTPVSGEHLVDSLVISDTGGSAAAILDNSVVVGSVSSDKPMP